MAMRFALFLVIVLMMNLLHCHDSRVSKRSMGVVTNVVYVRLF